jgi:hypothetical protein
MPESLVLVNHLCERKYREALAVAETCLSRQPNDEEIHLIVQYCRAWHFFNTGQHKESAKAIELALKSKAVRTKYPCTINGRQTSYHDQIIPLRDLVSRRLLTDTNLLPASSGRQSSPSMQHRKSRQTPKRSENKNTFSKLLVLNLLIFAGFLFLVLQKYLTRKLTEKTGSYRQRIRPLRDPCLSSQQQTTPGLFDREDGFLVVFPEIIPPLILSPLLDELLQGAKVLCKAELSVLVNPAPLNCGDTPFSVYFTYSDTQTGCILDPDTEKNVNAAKKHIQDLDCLMQGLRLLNDYGMNLLRSTTASIVGIIMNNCHPILKNGTPDSHFSFPKPSSGEKSTSFDLDSYTTLDPLNAANRTFFFIDSKIVETSLESVLN